MNESSPGVLILGGGVTGMSAALAMSDRNLAVHLVERKDHLGGHAAQWACMATDTCQNCGACLAIEMADKVNRSTNITLHLNTSLESIEPLPEGGIKARLSSGVSLTAAKAVMATGFTPFDGGTIASYHTDTLENVITTAELNTLIREDQLESTAGSAPKIAFLQCVGSRDREQNRDYCSQVCCKISMRHALKIRHLLPDADISLFYMDLQVIGKETRTMAAELSRDIHLIQGVPAEILQDHETGQLTMITEDPATQSRRKQMYDLIVLSVGMVPDPDTLKMAEGLGLSPNPWGFFTPGPADLISADPVPDIHIAGCARTPMNIPSSIQEGRIAAFDILCELNLAPSQKKMLAVFGSGPEACAVAAAAADNGYDACLFGKVDKLPAGVTDLSTAVLVAVEGTVNHFSILYQEGESKKRLACSAIIGALPPDIRDNTTTFSNALSLEAYTGLDPVQRPDNALILLDYFGPESKAASRMALTAAIDSKQAGRQVDILMNKMLVHGPDGQKLYDTARHLGIGMLRYNTPSDITIGSQGEGITLSLAEATLPGTVLELSPDTLVVPATPVPSRAFPEFSRELGIALDTEGFCQPANIRHRLVHTQRKGIYFAGSGHDDIDQKDLNQEIQAIFSDMSVCSDPLSPPPDQLNKGRVTINTNICASCLTCYRVCPHGAIVLNHKQQPEIQADACFECHACLSNCPAVAISCEGQANTDLTAGARKGRTLVFACERSGALAAAGTSLPGDVDLVTITCACRVSPDLILKALVQGADRVIVTGCHPGNCRSIDGSIIARRSAAIVTSLPGISSDRVWIESVAANEPAAFINAVSKAKKG